MSFSDAKWPNLKYHTAAGSLMEPPGELEMAAEISVDNVFLHVIGLWRRLFDSTVWPAALTAIVPFIHDLCVSFSSRNPSDLLRWYTKSISQTKMTKIRTVCRQCYWSQMLGVLFSEIWAEQTQDVFP